MLRREQVLRHLRGGANFTFRAKWVARSLETRPFHPGKLQAYWTNDHRRMMRKIQVAMEAGCYVTVTFRKPTDDDKLANAAEVGECIIVGSTERKPK